MKALGLRRAVALDEITNRRFVAKRVDSKYPIQLRSATEPTHDWVKHRFTTQ